MTTLAFQNPTSWYDDANTNNDNKKDDNDNDNDDLRVGFPESDNSTSGEQSSFDNVSEHCLKVNVTESCLKCKNEHCLKNCLKVNLLNF